MLRHLLAILRAMFSLVAIGKSQSITLSLYGDLYDVSDIAAWHPGGAAILRQAHSLQLFDATPLFESQHALRDPEEMLKLLRPYRVQETRKPQLYSFRENGFYRVVRHRVAAYLREVGYSKSMLRKNSTSPLHEDIPSSSPTKGIVPKGGVLEVWKWSMCVVCMFSLFTLGMHAKYTTTAGLYAFAAGILFFMAVLNLLHDASHYAAFTRSPERNDFASRWMQTMGWWNHEAWQAHHTLLHHTYTSDVFLDPDPTNAGANWCKVHQWYRCNAEYPRSPARQLAVALSTMYTGQVAEYFLLTKYGYHEETRAKRDKYGLVDIRGILFEERKWWQYPLAYWWLACVAAMYPGARARQAGRLPALARVVVALTLFVLGVNLCYAINILPNHDTLASNELLPQDQSNNTDEGRLEDWGELQVRASSNFAGPIWCFFFGGMNYQIEHHLFPTIYHGYYPQIAKVVRTTAEEYGIPYTHFDSAAHALVSVLAQFRSAAVSAEHEGYVRGEKHSVPQLERITFWQWAGLLLCAIGMWVPAKCTAPVGYLKLHSDTEVVVEAGHEDVVKERAPLWQFNNLRPLSSLGSNIKLVQMILAALAHSGFARLFANYDASSGCMEA